MIEEVITDNININIPQLETKEPEKEIKELERKQLETKEPEKEVSLEDIEECVKCDVCKDVLYDAKTILCQHTFCGSCLVSLKECPMCRLKLFLPSNNNNIFNNLANILYGKEKVAELKNKTKRDKLEKELNKTILDELQTSFNKSITSSTSTERFEELPNNQQEQINLINQSAELSTNITILGYSFDISLIIKYVEIAFLLYYIYGFCMSLRYGVNWFKLGLNLLIIFQSCYSIFLQ
jgi:hypothetical protein